jgi:transposase
MKKNSTGILGVNKGPITAKTKKEGTKSKGTRVIGLDLGDKSSCYCIVERGVGEQVEVSKEGKVATTKKGMEEVLGALEPCLIALEVGTHSPWISRLLKSLGHEVVIANARKVGVISQNSKKNDRVDAHLLARLALLDRTLLYPIQHRSEQAQLHLMEIRSRAALVEARTSLINTARGLVKASGERLPACDADQMGAKQTTKLAAGLPETLRPLLENVEALTKQIYVYDERIEQIARTHYPESKLLKQVKGVGTLIALTYLLTVEDPARFAHSRDVGCYVGLRPKQDDSGDSRKQLRITKEGDIYLRKLLVQGAHYIMGRRGPDTDLQRWGRKLAERGGKNGKKRAIVAVARKLSVLLHCLWVTGEVYEPLRNSNREAARQKSAAA